MSRVAIHGFGRIGRSALKVALKGNLFTPVSVSDIRDIPTLAAVFAVDSNYGRWPETVEATDKGFNIGGREIAYFNTAKELPNWGDLGIDLVIDCTGRATTREFAQAHLDKGAKKVLVSAASKSKADCDAMLLAGINLETYNPAEHHMSAWQAAPPTRSHRSSKCCAKALGLNQAFSRRFTPTPTPNP